MIRHGSAPYLECSSRGDTRFSAFYARIRSRGNRSIEDIYQAAKVFEDGTTGLSWREAKGRTPVNLHEIALLYRTLWREYLQENPILLPDLLQASGISDMFGQPGSQCQATELWRIRIESMLQGLSESGIGNIRIVSKRAGSTARPEPGEVVIDVDRSNPVLGNPFVLKNHQDHKERAKVIAQYQDYLHGGKMAEAATSSAVAKIAQMFLDGREIALSCWCAPLPCHAEVIRDAAIEMAWKIKMNPEADHQPQMPTGAAPQGSLF